MRQQSASGKRPSSPVEVACSDSGTKKSRKELQQQEAILSKDSERVSVTEMDNPLSASRETLASNHCPNSSFSPLSGHSTPPNGTVTNVDDTVINQEMENKVEEMHPLQALQRKNEASANGNSNLCSKEINSALNASLECQTTSASRKQVSTGTNSHSVKNVYSTRKLKMRKGLGGPETLQSSRCSKNEKAAECMKDSSLLMEGTKIQTQQKLDTIFEDTLNVNEATNEKFPQMVPPGFELMNNGKGTDANSNRLNKELTTTINSICEANKNADMLTDNAATQEVKSNHVMEVPTQSLDHLAQQDGANVNDRPLLLSSPNAAWSL